MTPMLFYTQVRKQNSEQIETLEADTHPFARGHKFGAAVGDMANQVDRHFLDLFVSVAQDEGRVRCCDLWSVK